MREFLRTLAAHPPAAIEEAFLDMIEQALERTDLVMVDDLHLVMEICAGCDYPRGHLLDAALTAIFGEALARGKKLVFAVVDDLPWPLQRRAYCWKIRDFEPEDYECIGRSLLGEAAARLDFARLHRFAPELSAQQLHNALVWLQREEFDTDRAIEYLRSHYMQSNVRARRGTPR